MGNMLKISKVFLVIAFVLFGCQTMCLIPATLIYDGFYWSSLDRTFLPFEFLFGWGSILIDILFNDKSK